MQTRSLRIRSYKSWRVNTTASLSAKARLKKLELYATLRQEGCSSVTALEALGWSRATYYRWHKRYQTQGWAGLEARSTRPRRQRQRQWTKQHEQQVLHLRQRHRLWGKRKLWKVLCRDQGFTLSISTVGRILKHLVARGRVRPAAFYMGQVKPKRRRQFTHHARRWQHGMKAEKPGQLIQLDHMTVHFTEGVSLKEFKATCPITGFTVMRAYRSASSLNARRFLYALIEQLPYPLLSVQVDGGSEFMAEFEQACKDLTLPLYVLPPKSPKYNGCVERANGTSRYEFYPFYEGPLTLAAINRKLAQYQHCYNYYRPHDGIGLETPMAYYQKLGQAA